MLKINNNKHQRDALVPVAKICIEVFCSRMVDQHQRVYLRRVLECAFGNYCPVKMRNAAKPRRR